MRKIMNASVAGILGLGIVTSAFAVDQNAAGLVTKTGVYGTGEIFVEIDTVIQEPGCENNRLAVSPTHPQRDRILAVATSAATSGKTLVIRTTGCNERAHPIMDTSRSGYLYIRP